MARQARRDDRSQWQIVGTGTTPDQKTVVTWLHSVSGERAVLFEGAHPWENPGAIQPPESAAMLPVTIAPSTLTASDDTEDDSPDDAVMALLQLGDGSSDSIVYIYRQSPGQDEEFCAKVPAGQFAAESYDLIRSRFGAGKYKIVLMGKKPGGRNHVRLKSQYISIAVDARPNGDVSSVAKSSDPVQLQTLELLARIADRLAAPPPPAPPATDQLQSLTMAVGLVTQIASVFKTTQPDPMAQIEKMVGYMDGIKKLRNAVDPDPVPDDPMTLALQGILPMIASGMQQRQAPSFQQPIPMVQAPPQVPPAAFAQPAPAPVLAPVNSATEDVAAMRDFAINWLVKQAAQNAPVETVAAAVEQYAPDDVFQAITVDNWRETVYLIAPALQPHDGYLSRVRDALLAMLSDQDDGGEPEPTPGPAPAPVHPSMRRK